MQNFLSLPAELLMDILFNFVEVVELCCLDVAICNRDQRPVWLEQLQQFGVLRKSIHGFVSSRVYLRWIYRRHIKVDSIFVDLEENPTEKSDLWTYLRSLGSGVQEVNLVDERHTWTGTEDLFMSCPNIHTVVFHSSIRREHHDLFENWLSRGSIKEIQLLNVDDEFVLSCLWAHKITQITIYSLLSDAFVLGMAEQCRGLKSLALHDKIDPALLKVLFEKCSSTLKELHICSPQPTGCYALIPLCTQLTSFGFMTMDGKFTDAHLSAIGQCCTKIHTLQLENCNSITDAGLEGFVSGVEEYKRCPLISIELDSLEKISDNGIAALARGTKDLTLISVCDCGADVSTHCLELIAATCPRCKNIEFYYDQWPKRGFANAVEVWGDSITRVALCYSSEDSDVDKAIVAITDYATNLRTLSLNDEWIGNPELILKMIRQKGGHLMQLKLVKLRLRQYPNDSSHARVTPSFIDDAFVSVLADHCPNLRYLDIAHSDVTEKGVQYLLSKCFHLRHGPPLSSESPALNINNCYKVNLHYANMLSKQGKYY